MLFPQRISSSPSDYVTRWSSRSSRNKVSRIPSKEEKHGGDSGCPLVDAVVERGARDWESPFHVPGHKRGSRITRTQRHFLGDSWKHDLTEIDGLDNLQSPTGAILEASRKAQKLWGSDHTWFLVNGATVGIHAAIMSTCREGSNDCLILARNAHQSAHNGVILAGCYVVYAMPECMCGMAHHMTPLALEKAFKRAKSSGMNPKAALVVSPTYYGVQSDIEALRQVCNEYNALLIVDEAHGAHLDFLPNASGSLQHGAHLVIQSTHKQLSSLTQSSMLHARNISTELENMIAAVLRMLQSSSPSYLLLSSLDASRQQMEDPESIEEPNAASMYIHDYFASRRGCLRSQDKQHEIVLLSSMLPPNVRCDPWRITIVLQSRDPSIACTGWSLASILEKKKGVVAEMATQNSVVFACGIGTTRAHANKLISSLQWLLQENVISSLATKVDVTQNIDYYKSLMTVNESVQGIPSRPRDIFFAPHVPVLLQEAGGKLVAETVTSYPPGIPILLPGDMITSEHIDYIRGLQDNGGSLIGPTDPTCSTILVMDDTP